MNKAKGCFGLVFIFLFILQRMCFAQSDILKTMSAPQILTLEAAVDKALKNNASIQLAMEKGEGSHFSTMEAKTAKLPRLLFETSVSKYRNTFLESWSFPSNFTFPGLSANINVLGINVPLNTPSFSVSLPLPSNITLSATTNYYNKFSLKYPLYTGGKLESLISQARVNEKIAGLEVERTKKDIVLQVAKSYYDVLKTKQAALLAKELGDLLRQKLKDAEAKLTKGKISEYEVLQLRTQLASAEQDALSSHVLYELTKKGLFILMGMDKNALVELQDENLTADALLQKDSEEKGISDALDISLSAGGFDVLENYACEHRVEMQQLKLSGQIARAGIGLARSNRMPNAGLNASYDFTGPQFPGGIKSWTVGMAASVPLYDFKETKWKVAGASSAMKQIETQEKQLKDKIALEVMQALLKLKEQEEKIKMQKAQVEEAGQAYAIAQVRFKSNLILEQELTDTKLYMLKAKILELQTTYDYKLTRMEFERAIGK